MTVVVPRFTSELSQSQDLRQTILDKVGDVSDFELARNKILVATYIRPEKTKGGIYRPNDNVAEDVWQAKCGLILNYGPGAFDENEFYGQTYAKGDWIVFRTGDTWSLSYKGVPCRVVSDSAVQGKVSDPETIF